MHNIIWDELCVSDGYPTISLAITEMLEHVFGFCALSCGDAINIAISVEALVT